MNDIEISDELGAKIKQASKKMKWHQRLPTKRNYRLFRQKLYKLCTPEEMEEYDSVQQHIKTKVFV